MDPSEIEERLNQALAAGDPFHGILREAHGAHLITLASDGATRVRLVARCCPYCDRKDGLELNLSTAQSVQTLPQNGCTRKSEYSAEGKCICYYVIAR